MDIEIKVNGDRLAVPEGTTLAALLTRLAIDQTRAAVEHNRRVIGRASYASLVLGPDDCLEIVTFVGGG